MTKLYMPPVKNGHISRETLIDKISGGKYREHKVTIVSAEAGYGKTTFVSEWISRLNNNYAWLSLDKYDNDPATFIKYLILAIRKNYNSFGSMIENIIQSTPKLPSVKVISSYITEELLKLNERLTLIFDDYHVINNSYIHKLTQHLIDSDIQNLFIVIITRKDPPFTLSMWRAQGRLTEIGSDDLRLETDEIREFFIKKFDFYISDKLLSILEEKTEGWAAALQLIGLSFTDKNEEQHEKSLAKLLNGNNRFIADYFMDEVFKRQSVQIQTFLKKTSILKSFNEELCNTVTGINDSRQIIEKLERENLLIVPLDNSRTWYRYHHLFSEFLRARVDKKIRTDVLVNASKWCYANGFIELAAEYALEAKNNELILSLISQITLKYLNDGTIKKLIEFLNSVKKICGRTDAEVDICRAWCLFIMGDTSEACKVINELGSFSEITDPDISGKIKALKSILYASTNRSKAYLYAADAVDILKNENRVFYNIALRTLGLVNKSAGKLTEAAEAFRGIIGGVDYKKYKLIEISAFANYADCLIAMGRRQEAQDICEELIKEYTDEYGDTLPLAKIVYLPMGICLYIANDLERAKSYLHDGISFCEEMKLMSSIGNAQMTYVKLLYILGEKSLAIKKLYKYNNFLKGPGLQSTLAMLEAIEADLCIMEENEVGVFEWMKRTEGMFGDPEHPFPENVTLTYIRVLIKKRRFSEASAKLAEEERTARNDGRYEQLITILILSALVEKYRNDENKALVYISEAVQIAAPGEYIRNFLDEGKDAILLARRVRHIAPEFVDKLDDNKKIVHAKGLVEELKAKEYEIIKLIAEGLSNDEISKRLYITTGTVKWYISNIYAKFGVNKRTQAVKKARQLGIIE